MYRLQCDEPHYVRSTYNEEMEQTERSIDTADGLEACEKYYWITSTEREDVLAVDDFMQGEKVITGLEHGTYDSLEEAHEDNPHTTKIQEDKPPF